ncbi:MAG: hypothetical protein RL007_2625 [Bacteroidota bacterium]|jgi:hypothetical protein|nr:hypothetical protein [Bacteroidia bacterium]
MAKTSTRLHPELNVKPEELISYVQEDYKFEAPKSIIDSILRYSKSLEVRKSKIVGTIETVSN